MASLQDVRGRLDRLEARLSREGDERLLERGNSEQALAVLRAELRDVLAARSSAMAQGELALGKIQECRMDMAAELEELRQKFSADLEHQHARADGESKQLHEILSKLGKELDGRLHGLSQEAQDAVERASQEAERRLQDARGELERKVEQRLETLALQVDVTEQLQRERQETHVHLKAIRESSDVFRKEVAQEMSREAQRSDETRRALARQLTQEVRDAFQPLRDNDVALDAKVKKASDEALDSGARAKAATDAAEVANRAAQELREAQARFARSLESAALREDLREATAALSQQLQSALEEVKRVDSRVLAAARGAEEAKGGVSELRECQVRQDRALAQATLCLQSFEARVVPRLDSLEAALGAVGTSVESRAAAVWQRASDGIAEVGAKAESRCREVEARSKELVRSSAEKVDAAVAELRRKIDAFEVSFGQATDSLSTQGGEARDRAARSMDEAAAAMERSAGAERVAGQAKAAADALALKVGSVERLSAAASRTEERLRQIESRGDRVSEAVERRLLSLEGRGEVAAEACRQQMNRLAEEMRAEGLGHNAALPRHQLQLEQVASRVGKLEVSMEDRGSTIMRQVEERVRKGEARGEAAEKSHRSQLEDLLEKSKRHELRLVAVGKVADEAMQASANAESFFRRSQRLLDQLETELRTFVQSGFESLEGRLTETASELHSLASSTKSREQGMERRMAETISEVTALESACRQHESFLAEARASLRADIERVAGDFEQAAGELQATVRGLVGRLDRDSAAATHAAQDAAAQRAADHAGVAELQRDVGAKLGDMRCRVEELEIRMVEARASASTLVTAFGSLAPRPAEPSSSQQESPPPPAASPSRQRLALSEPVVSAVFPGTSPARSGAV